MVLFPKRRLVEEASESELSVVELALCSPTEAELLLLGAAVLVADAVDVDVAVVLVVGGIPVVVVCFGNSTGCSVRLVAATLAELEVDETLAVMLVEETVVGLGVVCGNCADVDVETVRETEVVLGRCGCTRAKVLLSGAPEGRPFVVCGCCCGAEGTTRGESPLNESPAERVDSSGTLAGVGSSTGCGGNCCFGGKRAA